MIPANLFFKGLILLIKSSAYNIIAHEGLKTIAIKFPRIFSAKMIKNQINGMY